MSNKMDSSLETYGHLFFFRKNDESKGASYPLCAGDTNIGRSLDADVRLKLSDNRLEEIHCIIKVEESGKVSTLNVRLLTQFSNDLQTIKMYSIMIKFFI